MHKTFIKFCKAGLIICISISCILSFGQCAVHAPIAIYDITLKNNSLSPAEINVASGTNIMLKFYNHDPCSKTFKSKDLATTYIPGGGEIYLEPSNQKPVAPKKLAQLKRAYQKGM